MNGDGTIDCEIFDQARMNFEKKFKILLIKKSMIIILRNNII
jgi:hypothetical protein